MQLNKTANEARSESPHSAALAGSSARDDASRWQEEGEERPDTFIDGLASGERERPVSEPPADALEHRSVVQLWMTGGLCLLAGFLAVRLTAGPVEAIDKPDAATEVVATATGAEVLPSTRNSMGSGTVGMASAGKHSGEPRSSALVETGDEAAAPAETGALAAETPGAESEAEGTVSPEALAAVTAAPDTVTPSADVQEVAAAPGLGLATSTEGRVALFASEMRSPSPMGPPSPNTPASVRAASGAPRAAALGTSTRPTLPESPTPASSGRATTHLATNRVTPPVTPPATAKHTATPPTSRGPRVLPPEAPLPVGGPRVEMGRVAYIRCGEGDPAAMQCKRDIALELRMMNVLQRLPHCSGAPEEFGHGDLRMEFRDGLLHNAWMKNVRRKPAITGNAWMSCARQVTQGLVTRRDASPLVISFRFVIEAPR